MVITRSPARLSATGRLAGEAIQCAQWGASAAHGSFLRLSRA